MVRATCWLALSLVLAAPAAAFEVGVAPATSKILPDTPLPEDTSAYLRAARNEWEGFQIVVRSGAPLSGVDAQVGQLMVCPSGAEIPSSASVFG